MKKKLFVSLMIGCFIIVSSTSTFAQKRNLNRPGMKFHTYMVQQNMIPAQVILKMKDHINLSEEQTKKITDLHLDFKKYTIDIKAKTGILNLNLEKCFNEKMVSKKKVASVLKELGSLKTAMEITHINHLLDVRSILTADQIALLEKLKQDRRKSMWNKKRDHFKKRSIR